MHEITCIIACRIPTGTGRSRVYHRQSCTALLISIYLYMLRRVCALDFCPVPLNSPVDPPSSMHLFTFFAENFVLEISERRQSSVQRVKNHKPNGTKNGL